MLLHSMIYIYTIWGIYTIFLYWVFLRWNCMTLELKIYYAEIIPIVIHQFILYLHIFIIAWATCAALTIIYQDDELNKAYLKIYTASFPSLPTSHILLRLKIEKYRPVEGTPLHTIHWFLWAINWQSAMPGPLGSWNSNY